MRTKSIIVAAILSATLLGPATALGAAETETFVATVPIDETFSLGCTSELFRVTGEVRFVVHFTIDGSGGFHLVATSMSHLRGVGVTSGQEYRINTSNPQNLNETAATTNTLVSRFAIVAAGPDNNLLGHVTAHFTINANGELTAETFVAHAEQCSGG